MNIYAVFLLLTSAGCTHAHRPGNLWEDHVVGAVGCRICGRYAYPLRSGLTISKLERIGGTGSHHPSKLRDEAGVS